MVRIPDLETIIATKPLQYRSRNMTNLFAIIDCIEVFIETRQDLKLQSVTCISTTTLWSFWLLFVQTVTSAMYRQLIREEFQTLNWLKTVGFCVCYPNKHVSWQTKALISLTSVQGWGLLLKFHWTERPVTNANDNSPEDNEDCKLANTCWTSYHRLKSFQFLKYELSLTSTEHIDEAIIVCAALCNLKRPLYSM